MTDKNKETNIITLPKAGRDEEQAKFVCINGKTYLVPAGKSTQVPPAVYNELKRAERAAESFDSQALSLRFAR